MTDDIDNMSTPVTRGELCEEPSQVDAEVDHDVAAIRENRNLPGRSKRVEAEVDAPKAR